MVTKFDYDDLGRELVRIQNYVADSSSSSSAGNTCSASADTNVTVQTAYNADGNVSSVTAVNAATGNQTTQYVYGTTLSDSEVASSLLKRAEIYPDSTGGSDQITFAYNRQSQTTVVVDQGGTTHSYDYDKLGRQTQDRVTALGSGVDGAVRRIASTYEVRGMRKTLTSYDNQAVGSGNIVNDNKFVYNDFSQLTTEYQSHSGAVNMSTTAKVQYTYASGSANTVRATGMVYPSGRVLTYAYGSTGSQADRHSRVASYIDDDGTSHIVDYTYLGAASFVEGDRPQPQMKWTLVDLSGTNDPDTGDIYSGLDRFGRVKDNRWYGYGTSTDLDRIQYGYDRAGNRIWRRNTVAAALSKEFDEIYTYDGVQRLKDMARGLLNTNRTALTSKTFAQCWTLDTTGNWTGFREDDTGDGTWDLVQARSANTVNEIGTITNSVGAAWVQPAYSPAGNMTTMPQPNDPTKGYTATYDAWNRLVKIVDTTSSNNVSEYAYDGAKRQVVVKAFTSGTLTETRHLYYTDPASWRCIEETISPLSGIPDIQNIWGRRFMDELILRDSYSDSSSSASSGTASSSPNTAYPCHDGLGSVTALINSDVTVYTRFAYLAYGSSIALTRGFEEDPDLGKGWNRRFAGYIQDVQTGLLIVRNRTLHPACSWIQRDPLPSSAASSLYDYVYSRPGVLRDPTGEFVPLALLAALSPEAVLALMSATAAVYLLIQQGLTAGAGDAIANAINDAVEAGVDLADAISDAISHVDAPCPKRRKKKTCKERTGYPQCSMTGGPPGINLGRTPDDAARLRPRDPRGTENVPYDDPSRMTVVCEGEKSEAGAGLRVCPAGTSGVSPPSTRTVCHLLYSTPDGVQKRTTVSVRCCPCCQGNSQQRTCNSIHESNHNNRKGQ